MPQEMDVWRIAKLLIDQHSDDADTAALRYRNQCESHGLHDGAAFCRRVLDVIAELQNEKVPTPSNCWPTTERRGRTMRRGEAGPKATYKKIHEETV